MTIQTTYTQARAGLASLLDQVTNDRDVVIIKRRGEEEVAMIAADELESLMETAYLLRSPANAERLLSALGRALKNEGNLQSLDGLKQEVKPEYRKMALEKLNMVEDILRDPFQGIGKPEPLKYLAPGTWSRRLTREHRIVYLVRESRIDFLQARYHY